MEKPEVSEFTSPNKEIISALKESPMSFTAEAVRAEMAERVQQTVRLSPGQTVKARLNAAAKFLGLSAGRVADYVYGEVRRVEAHEADRIRAFHEQAKRRRLAELEAEYAALRAEMVADAPKGMGALVPPEIGEAKADAVARKVAR